MLPDSRSLHHIMRRKKKVEEELSILIGNRFWVHKNTQTQRGKVKKSPRGFQYPWLKVPTLVHMYNWFETLLLNDFKTYSQL